MKKFILGMGALALLFTTSCGNGSQAGGSDSDSCIVNTSTHSD